MSSFPVSRSQLQSLERLAREKKRSDYIQNWKKNIHSQVVDIATAGKAHFYKYHINQQLPSMASALLYQDITQQRGRNLEVSTADTELIMSVLESILIEMYPDATISMVNPSTYVYPPYMEQREKMMLQSGGPYIVIDWS